MARRGECHDKEREVLAWVTRSGKALNASFCWLVRKHLLYLGATKEMIASLLSFVIAFLFSFVGTIPPGTLSLTIIQLGLKGKIDIAWRMSIAAALIEYPYAWIAVEFQGFLAESLELTHNFHLVTNGIIK